jgi:hypothetical protein
MSGFKKGDLLRVTSVSEIGFSASGSPRGVRVLTTAERERLAADPYYQGLGEDGETRLIPRYRNDRIEPGKNVIVIRARATAPRELGWGKWANGHVLVLDPSTGNELYIKRQFLEALGAREEGVVTK